MTEQQAIEIASKCAREGGQEIRQVISAVFISKANINEAKAMLGASAAHLFNSRPRWAITFDLQVGSVRSIIVKVDDETGEGNIESGGFAILS